MNNVSVLCKAKRQERAGTMLGRLEFQVSPPDGRAGHPWSDPDRYPGEEQTADVVRAQES